MGEWIKRVEDTPPPHQHDYPSYNDKGDIRVGDIWRCSCWTYFQVDMLTQAADGEGVNWRAMWPDETKDFK